MNIIDRTQTDVVARTDAQRRIDFWTTQRASGKPFRYWQDLVCRELVELQIDTPQPTGFEASMLRRRLGSLSFNLIDARQQAAARTPEGIRRTVEPRFDLVHIRQGSIVFEHYGRRFGVQAGQCVLIDSSQTYTFTTSDFTSSASLQIPQKWLRAWVPTPEDSVTRVIGTETPWGNALLASLNALTPQTLATLAIPEELLAEQIASLLALGIGSQDSGLTPGQQKLLPRVLDTLQQMAHDEQVCPQSVADTHGISKRYLHAVFAAAGTTFSRELFAIRLERAARLLRDPRFRKLSVSEIGWRCGFSDSSHFARRFARKFGQSPSQFRGRLPAVHS